MRICVIGTILSGRFQGTVFWFPIELIYQPISRKGCPKFEIKSYEEERPILMIAYVFKRQIRVVSYGNTHESYAQKQASSCHPRLGYIYYIPNVSEVISTGLRRFFDSTPPTFSARVVVPVFVLSIIFSPVGELNTTNLITYTLSMYCLTFCIQIFKKKVEIYVDDMLLYCTWINNAFTYWCLICQQHWSAARQLIARTEEPATKTSVTALRNTSDNNAKNVDISY